MHRPLLLPILCQLTLLASAHAVTSRDNITDAAAQTLASDSAYASVGKFTRSDSDITSGVLIDSSYVLTAAHIINGFAGNDFTFTIGGFDYQTVGYTVSGVDDLAIFQLALPVNNVTPALLYTGSTESLATATLVGFGQGGTGSSGATTGRGTKRAATNVIDHVTGQWLYSDFDNPDGLENTLLTTYGIPSSPTPTTSEGGIALGDSGGGTFATISSQTYLIGIHSGVILDGDGINYNYGDISADVRLSSATAQSFIQSVVPEPSSLACLGLGLAVLGARRSRKR